MTNVRLWSARLLALGFLGLATSGCPALLDDEFEIVNPGADASTGGTGATGGGGSGGSAGADGGGTGGSSGSAGADAGPECDDGQDCAVGEECCDRQCVDTEINPTHCGVCGKGCPGTTCDSSACTNQCQFGWLDCDQNVVSGCEVNAASDPENCGNCNTACAFDQTCEAGKCTCPEGSADCNGDLEDGCETSTGADPANCGACGTSCGQNQICESGGCACGPGFADCNNDPMDGCEANLATSEKHCGACNAGCGENGACANQQCGCAPGFLNCDGVLGCEAAKNDPATCGSCSVQCGGASPVCNGTACVAACGGGQTLCSGSCANLQTDPLHCGSCGNAVGPNELCVGSSPQCQPGFGNCNAQPGCETDTTSDKNHCGGCNQACKPGAICAGGTCQCAAGTPNDCGSSCQECCNAAQCSDGNPCTTNSCTGGSCSYGASCAGGGNCCPALGCFECCNDGQCTGGKVCSNNQCVLPTCTGAEILCGGACVNPNTNASHCGTCGNDCGPGRTCAGAECTPKWVTIGASPNLSARAAAASAYVTSASSVFIWGGQGASGALDTGALYNVSTGAFTALPVTGSTPSPRVLATAVWTGQVVVVWGGGDPANSTDYGTGAMYDVASGTWTAMSTTGAPSARRAPYAVYTGNGVLFWGGHRFNGTAVNGAFLFDPTLNEWKSASIMNDPNAVLHPTVGWSGSSFYVFGGLAGATSKQFHVYAPGADTWTPLTSGAVERFGALGGWDGSYFVTWGGRKEGGGPPQEWSDGRRWEPQNGWATVSAPPASMTARHAPHRESGWSARISGGNSLLLGGVSATNAVQKNGAIYNSTTNTWTAVPAWPSGEDRRYAVGVWTGSELVLWGGVNGSTPSATGERFRP